MVWKPEIKNTVSFLNPLHLVFWDRSLPEPRAQQLARQVGQHLRMGLTWPAFLSVLECTLGYRFTPRCQDFHMAARDPNSGLSSHQALCLSLSISPASQDGFLGFILLTLHYSRCQSSIVLFAWSLPSLVGGLTLSLNTNADIFFNPYKDPLLFTVISWGWLCICENCLANIFLVVPNILAGRSCGIYCFLFHSAL